MIKLYRELFYIPKHGKISEKNMLARMVSTIAIVVVCLAAMSITAYAYFSANITSSSNIIKSATFQTEVQVQITDQAGNAVDTVAPITSDYKSFRIEGLKIGEKYIVTIQPKKTETSAQTGFVILSADEDKCNDIFHTQQLGTDKSAPGERRDEIKFYLIITDTTDVYLRAHWGTSSYYGYVGYLDVANDKYIRDGDTITMIVNGHTTPNVPKTEDTSNDTSGTTEKAPDTTGTDATTNTTTPPATETTPPETSTETTGTNEETTVTDSTTEETTGETEAQTIEPAATETTTTTETQPATVSDETTETTGTTNTEANE